MSKQSVIYFISWTNNEYFYIGQTQSFRTRKSQHLCKLRKRLHSNKKFQNVFNKYGEPKFQVLEYCEVEELNTIEQWYLNEFVGKENCLNIAKDVLAPKRGLKHSDKAKKKMSEIAKGRSKEVKQKIYKSRSKPILQYSKNREFIKEWISIGEAAQAINVDKSCIRRCCTGKRNSVKGFIFSFKSK